MLLYAPWPFLNNLLNLLVILGSKPIMLSRKLIYDDFEFDNLTQLISKTLITSDDLIWEALTRCSGEFWGLCNECFSKDTNWGQCATIGKACPFLVGVYCMAHRINLVVHTLSKLPIVSRLKGLL
jgi:hypothetical protein